jgi:hypothetical protein
MKRDAPSSTKMKRLCRLLDIPLHQAVGLLELLWHLTAREAPRGNIGKLTNETIALALDYRGDENRLIDAWIRTGWLDEDGEYRLLIHDWHEHADEAVKKRLTRSGQSFILARRVETNQPNVETKAQNGKLPRAGAGPVPVPVPHPGPEPVVSPPSSTTAQPTGVAGAPSPPVAVKQPAKNHVALMAYVNLWKERCLWLSKVQKLTDQRTRRLSARIAEGLTLSQFEGVLAKIQVSPFLLGESKSRWRIDFDFVIANGTNIQKILEGGYDRATSKPKPVRKEMPSIGEDSHAK